MVNLLERHLPQYASLLSRAALFTFPGNAHEVLRHDAPAPEEWRFLEETFFLPFPVTAVEDPASCVVLADSVPDAVGFATPRLFIECCPVSAPDSAFPEDGKPDQAELARQHWRQEAPDACGIVVGSLDRLVYRDGHRYFTGQVHGQWILCRDRILAEDQGALRNVSHDDFNNQALRGAATCAEEIMWFNAPNRFVFETSPVRVARNHLRSGRVLRSHERPQYTLVTPHEARVKLGLAEPTGRHPTPHARRKHYRKLSSERFTHKQGQVITVPACWVGPSEVVRGNKRYRVLLEL
jgi:hypothetical protein